LLPSWQKGQERLQAVPVCTHSSRRWFSRIGEGAWVSTGADGSAIVPAAPLGRCFSACAQQAGFVALPVAVFLAGALVVLLLALGEADAQLGAAVFPVHLERHQGVAGALD